MLRDGASAPYAVVLGALAALFLSRVAGQALVAFASVPVLPAMPHWYSGLLPYELLLPLQVAVLLVQAVLAAFIATVGHYHAARGRA